MNFIIQDAESIVCMVELLEHCQVTCQAEIWSMFTAILRKSMRNLQTCTEVGLIQLVLLKMSSVDDMIAGTSRNTYPFLCFLFQKEMRSENCINDNNTRDDYHIGSIHGCCKGVMGGCVFGGRE